MKTATATASAVVASAPSAASAARLMMLAAEYPFHWSPYVGQQGTKKEGVLPNRNDAC